MKQNNIVYIFYVKFIKPTRIGYVDRLGPEEKRRKEKNTKVTWEYSRPNLVWKDDICWFILVWLYMLKQLAVFQIIWLRRVSS